jgi:hypothetical protein
VKEATCWRHMGSEKLHRGKSESRSSPGEGRRCAAEERWDFAGVIVTNVPQRQQINVLIV